MVDGDGQEESGGEKKKKEKAGRDFISSSPNSETGRIVSIHVVTYCSIT